MIDEQKRIEYHLNMVRAANRLLVIQSHLEDYYGVDCWKVGSDRPESKDKNYTNVLYLGLVVVAYGRLFGDRHNGLAYRTYSELCGRERTTGYHWMKRAKESLDVYPKQKDEFDKFIDERWLAINKDCKSQHKTMRGGYVKLAMQIDKEMFAKDKKAA